MPHDRAESEPRTDRRSLLRTVAAGAAGTTVFAGAASAESGSGGGGDGGGEINPMYCVEHITQTRCVDADCECCNYGCDCESKRQERTCCKDPYGDIKLCGTWTDTGECCVRCSA